jgi:hypothetical protein
MQAWAAHAQPELHRHAKFSTIFATEEVPLDRCLEYDKISRKRVGANRLSALQRTITIAKLATLLSAVSTILCAVVIVGVQVTAWIRTGMWEAYRLGSVIRGLKGGRADVYVTASTTKSATELTDTQVLLDWFLEIPTTALLLAVAVLHFAFYLYVVAIEQRQYIRGHRWQSDAESRRGFW